MEGDFIKYRTNNEEESDVKAPESAEQPSMDLCSGLAEFANVREEEIVAKFSHIRTDGTKCYVIPS